MTQLVFGVDRDPGVAEELIERGGDRVKNGKGRLGAFKANPLIPLYGPGPDGARCWRGFVVMGLMGIVIGVGLFIYDVYKDE